MLIAFADAINRWRSAVPANRLPPARPLARMTLADGRILIVEGVTFGTRHRMGPRSDFFERFGNWIPQPLRDQFAPRIPESKFQTKQPALVVWVEAVDPATGTNMDCQGIRLEFANRRGDLFGAGDSHWFGGAGFWRMGHVFYSFPRDEEKLTFCATPWRTNQTQRCILENPHRSTAVTWAGGSLPQARKAGGLEIFLAGLEARTNELAKQPWITPCRYWEPRWVLSQNGKPAVGWTKPEWIAEDPVGNRGQHLGIHQPVLRFSVTVFPDATNANAVNLIATSPPVSLPLANDIWWHATFSSGTKGNCLMGICPPGTRVFSGGNLTRSLPVVMGVAGGAPSGWTLRSQRTSPVTVTEWHNHYSDKVTIYVHSDGAVGPERFAVRLRDSEGRLWVATPEPQGHRGDIHIHAFLVDVGPEVTNFVAELVSLKPVQAQFLVRTPPVTP
ncbi:MAG: hypothetical protein M1608_05400 [Candidatus Omnitrophica bacterium]|nr:hypothetical protein [Candidatus Omnitrophota bacterium]